MLCPLPLLKEKIANQGRMGERIENALLLPLLSLPGSRHKLAKSRNLPTLKGFFRRPLFFPAAQPTGQGKESVLLLVVVVKVTTFHTAIYTDVHSKGQNFCQKEV